MVGGRLIEIEIIKLVISNIFSIVTIAWSSGMAWWLSSVVLVITIMTKLYPLKSKLKQNSLFIPAGIISSMIIISLIIFGIVVINDLSVLETDLYSLIANNYQNYALPSSLSIFSIVRKLYVLVTSNLIIFLLAWLYLWFSDKPSFSINGE